MPELVDAGPYPTVPRWVVEAVTGSGKIRAGTATLRLQEFLAGLHVPVPSSFAR